MSAVIEVSHLTKQFKDVKAVDDLSFTVHETDVYGFLGQNGAGKSTTIRMLLTLIKPTEGEITIFGKKLSSHREEILTNIGAIIEKTDLYKYLSAYDNLAFLASISGVKVSRTKLMELLETVGLADRAHSKVKTFSQGMKQRLGIAVALVHDPSLIILDEPTNGLDPQGIADIRNLILGLSKNFGKTILLSSHLLTEIELIANKILIIDGGRKIVEGTAHELLDPAKTIVEIVTTNVVADRVKVSVGKWSNFLQENSKGLHFQLDRKEIPELIQDLVAMGIQILSVEHRHSLENYFLSITNPPHVEAASV